TDARRFYSYEFSEASQGLLQPTIYELDADAVHLAKVIDGKTATWTGPSTLKVTEAEVLTLKDLEMERQVLPEIQIASVDLPSVFQPSIDKPSQLSAVGLTSYLNSAKRRGEDVSSLAVALQ